MPTVLILAGFCCLLLPSLPVLVQLQVTSSSEHLNNQGYFKPVNCSCTIKTDRLGQQVMQIIDGQYYLWQESVDYGNKTICIYQFEPEEKALSAEEACKYNRIKIL